MRLDSFVESLIKIGYRRVTTVMEPGEFSIKGALIDLYPMGAANPFRIDLFDNEIDSIRSFDPSTQRSIEVIEEIHLLPAREFASDSAALIYSRKTICLSLGILMALYIQKSVKEDTQEELSSICHYSLKEQILCLITFLITQ